MLHVVVDQQKWPQGEEPGGSLLATAYLIIHEPQTAKSSSIHHLTNDLATPIISD